MKLNFKKIVPVLTGAILLGSTIGFATSVAGVETTYPDSFSDATVVIGSASLDAAPAADIAADLGKLSASTSLSGENVKIQSNAENLNLGEALSDVQTSTIDSGDLPSLLKDGSIQVSGAEYDYEQTISLATGLTYTYLQNNKLSDDAQLAVQIDKNAAVLNYTLEFNKDVQSEKITSNRFTDIEGKKLEILGKPYTILTASNQTGNELVLMGGSVSDVLEEGATQDYVVKGKTYSVSIGYIGDAPEVKLIVNGESTISLDEKETYTLSDKTVVGITDIMYQSKTGSVSSVEFTLGAEKLTLKNNIDVKMGEDTIEGLRAFITGDGESLSKIILQWKASQTAFISNLGVLTLPGLESFDIQMGDLSVAAKEKILLQNNGEDAMELTMPIEDGIATFDLLYGNGVNFTGLGEDVDEQLAYSTGAHLFFNESKDSQFVVTYVSGPNAESYLLEATTREDVDAVKNYTSVKNLVTNLYECEDKEVNERCEIGSFYLTVNAINPDAETVNFTRSDNTKVFFDRIVSEEGLQMAFPTVTPGSNVVITFTEENYDTENIAAGDAFTVTSAYGDNGMQISGTNITTYEVGNSDEFVGYLISELATKVSHDKSSDQDTLEIEYHGEEVVGNVWISAPGLIVGSALVVKDIDLNPAQRAGNLVVVGGPAINSIAAELLGLDFPTYGTDPNSGFSPGMAQITLFENELTPGSVALLVAGYAKDDTMAASRALINPDEEHKGSKIYGTLLTTSASAYTYA